LIEPKGLGVQGEYDRPRKVGGGIRGYRIEPGAGEGVQGEYDRTRGRGGGTGGL